VRSLSRRSSVGFENEPEYDELDYAAEAAWRFGCEHTSLEVFPPEPELLEILVHHHDGPFGDSSAIPTYAVSRLARREVTVVLNGDGGDELFCGYSRLAAAAFSERIPRPIRELAAFGGRFLPAPRSHAGSLRRVRQFLEVTGKPLRQRIQAWSSFFRGRELDRLLRNDLSVDPGDHFERHLREAKGGSPMARLLHFTYCTYLPEDLLVKMDRMTMAHGLEPRSPFLDTALAEFVGELPDSFKARGLSTKVVLRESFRDLVPSRILDRRKMGFGVPVGPWLRGGLRPFVTAHLASEDLPLFQYLDRDAVTVELFNS
jgi:asparagine synthase (glutamine-hydrolysing)